MSGHIIGRRFLLLLLLGLLVSGCSSSPTASAPAFKGTITLWAAPGLAGTPLDAPSLEWFRERAVAYEAAHSGVKVQIVTFASPQELESTVLAPGNRPQPDLFFGRFLDDLAPRLADAGAVVLPAEAADYLKNGLDAFSSGNVLHGLPVLLEVQALALNKQAFELAGLPLPDGGKWSAVQFADSLEKLSQHERFGLGFYALSGYHEWWPLASGIVQRDGTLAPDAEAGLTRLAGYRRQGYLHPDTGKLKAADTWALFTKNPPAFGIMPVAGWAVPALREHGAAFAVAGFPDGINSGYTYGFSFFQQANSRKLQAVVDLARFMATPDQQVRLARETGLVPARRAAGNPFAGDEQMSRVYELGSAQKPLPAGPAWDRQEAASFRPLLYVLLNSMEPRVAITELQTAINPAAK